ncbi:MAG: outer membrane protein assembly factor BamC [Gammaproteobacteria bacterium]|nr:outer membrane protein assembly factor BamC [Gammaproteobacteria bacterium]
MKLLRLKPISLAILLATVTGCNSLPAIDEVVPDNTKKYRKAETMPPLDIPPDLSTSRINDDIVGKSNSSATYSEFEQATNNPLASRYNITPESKPTLSGEGDKRHVIAPGDRELIWQRLLDFWSEKGIEISRKDIRIGLMDTARIDGENYAYRVRMERGESLKQQDIYVGAAGFDTNATKDEAMLRQLADYLGVLQQEQQAKVQAQKQSQPQQQTVNVMLIDDVGGQQALMIEQDFSDVWRRVGRVLDSKGFSVEDRDRSRGNYYVHYIDPFNEAEKEEEGLLSSLAFWRDDDEKSPGEYYYIKLISDAEKTKIIILDSEEVRTSSPTAKRLLGLMQEQLAQ